MLDVTELLLVQEVAAAAGTYDSQTAISQDCTADDPATPSAVGTTSSSSIWRHAGARCLKATLRFLRYRRDRTQLRLSRCSQQPLTLFVSPAGSKLK
ncbi:hypothetical protein KIN20_025906 [Parelaphostrongylus tenuis]|uniref:Uncharacterized protein n=1 Tax=Parelaphostrongylus tenuis TaxID=148309 RepID=A0AAD5MZZ4_PARTN|nr:hypothetical protein KIN20_003729 [Parelaphostrongylus tenuis]KAJ1365538.1 hypothetical protein KIN20_025902 [Parelaphostrongylus tenuis]KAJ1365540.1 hypothetical protein KIN20_025906 [Parelaphostrongylus tenuis]